MQRSTVYAWSKDVEHEDALPRCRERRRNPVQETDTRKERLQSAADLQPKDCESCDLTMASNASIWTRRRSCSDIPCPTGTKLPAICVRPDAPKEVPPTRLVADKTLTGLCKTRPCFEKAVHDSTSERQLDFAIILRTTSKVLPTNCGTGTDGSTRPAQHAVSEHQLAQSNGTRQEPWGGSGKHVCGRRCDSVTVAADRCIATGVQV